MKGIWNGEMEYGAKKRSSHTIQPLDQALVELLKGAAEATRSEDPADSGFIRKCTAALSGHTLFVRARKALSIACEVSKAGFGCLMLFRPELWTVWSEDRRLPVGPWPKAPSEDALAAFVDALQGRRTVWIADAASETVPQLFREYWKQSGVRCALMVPVMVDNDLYGFFTLYDPERQPFPTDMLELVAAMMAEQTQCASLRDENERLQYLDPLTGYLNAMGFQRWAAEIMSENPQRKYAIGYTDIKRFKYINDAFGYELGDQLLRHWAKTIHDDLRDGEILGRTSGDNLTFLTYYEDEAELERRFWSRVELVRGFLSVPGRPFEVEIATGLYLAEPKDAVQPDINQMLDWANAAQKSVKGLSGSRLAFFTKEIWEQQLRELEICQHMRDAVEAGEFSVWFQPQYNYASGSLIGAETLVRWDHPTLGRLSPGEFVPLLERTGQIYILDQFVWGEACRYMRKWMNDSRLPQISLSVNVSRIDIRAEGLCQLLCELTDQYGIPRRMLRLEITESAYMEEPEQLVAVAGCLQELGFAVEMDDFGSGYSSLNTLKEVPVDVLKLDMRFLANRGDSVRGGNILSSVVRMAHWMGLPVIAEGVETVEQAEYLKSLGCNIMQGYYFARPMSADEFERLLLQSCVEHIRLEQAGATLNMAEFLDSSGKSSFLFHHCIGGAVLLEYSGDTVEALMLNDAFYQTMGLDRTICEPYRTRFPELVEPEDRKVLRQSLDRTVREGMDVCVVRVARTLHPEDRWIRMVVRRVSSGTRSHFLFVLMSDVTQQHELRLKLDEVSEELVSYLELMPGGVFRYALDGDGSFDYISPGLPGVLGYTQEAFQKKFSNRFTQMVCPADRKKVLRNIERATRAGERSYCEYRVEAADGTWKWIYQSGRTVTDARGKVWFYAVITDIDSQKKAELNKLYETYGKTITAMFSEVVDVDYVNDRVVLLHSREHPSMVEKTVSNIARAARVRAEQLHLSGPMIERFVSFVGCRQVQEASRSNQQITMEFASDDGQWYRGMLLPLNEVRCLFCAQCITAEKQAERLRVESARYDAIENLLANLPIGTAVFELHEDGTRTLRYVSRAACRILKMPQEALTARFEAETRTEYLPIPDDAKQLELCIQHGRAFRRRLFLPEADGMTVCDLLTNLIRKQNGVVVGYTAVLDAADRLHEEHTRLWHHTLYQLLAEMSMMAAFDYDPRTDIMTKRISMPGRGAEEVVEEHYLEELRQKASLAPEHMALVENTMETAVRTPVNGTLEFRADYFGMGYRWVRAQYASLVGEDGVIYRVVGRLDDIQAEKEREEELENMARKDAMTGFLNHNASQKSVEAAVREAGGGTLFVLDIDDFKRVNDELGHLYGDTFLRSVAKAVQELFRHGDILGRFGGDEFVIFMPGVSSETLAATRAEAILEAIRRIQVAGISGICCSIGVAITRQPQTSWDQLFHLADLALYDAKRSGKGSYALRWMDSQKTS